MVITAEECRRASIQLKNNKAVDCDGVQAEHLKHTPESFFIHTAGLYTGIVKHGCIPDNLNMTIIVPIVKEENGNRNDPDNYIGIAMSSVSGKLLKKVLVTKYKKYWLTEDQQFGFKARHGCDMSTFVVKETVSHFLENSDDVMFGCFLDLSRQSLPPSFVHEVFGKTCAPFTL